MQPPFPSPTAVWHNDTYEAIDPTRPENSQAGKTVIITGAGSGIGREIAIAFATAGARKLILVGRTESTLLETQKLLPSNGSTTSEVCVASVVIVDDMRKVVQAAGTWDTFVLNAGHLNRPSTIAEADIDNWWAAYETNVKALLITAKLFLPTATGKGASLIAVTAGGVCLPPAALPGLSGYMTSKTAQIKVLEWLAVENPTLFTCAVQPGIVETKMLHESGLSMPHSDKAALPAHFMVWLSQPKAKFLNKKFVFANWDVDELCGRAEEIRNSDFMTINALGWPYTH